MFVPFSAAASYPGQPCNLHSHLNSIISFRTLPNAATTILFLTHMISCLALDNIETRICFNRRQTCVQSAAYRQMHCLHAGILIDEFYLNPVLLNTAIKRSLITCHFSTCIGLRILNHCVYTNHLL